MKFTEFKKIPRLSRDIIVTEKLDGCNNQIFIVKKDTIFNDNTSDYENYQDWLIAKNDDCFMFVGSRNRWLQIGKQTDNHGFASWVQENSNQLFELGEGRHFGEWYGYKIQRGYGLDYKRFALFNVSKWQNKGENLYDENQKYCPSCCEVVPILYEGIFDTTLIDMTLHNLITEGSRAVPGFMNPEGIIIYHTASAQYFKKTCQNDEKPKGLKT